MDYTTLPALLKQIENMSAFSRISKIPRRTLERVATGTSNPSLKTCQVIEAALKKHKPAKRGA